MQYAVELGGEPFNLEYTLESGQVFRWEKKGEWWYGPVDGGVLKVKQDRDSLYCESNIDGLDASFVRRFFRLDEDLKGIIGTFMKGKVMTGAVQRFYGLRLIRQERWECLASFVLATNSNIPSIRRMIANVCEGFGEPFLYEGLQYRRFPSAEKIAEAPLQSLAECGLGYRAPFLKRVAEAIHEGRLELSELALLDYPDAKELLLKKLLGAKLLLGVGPKVADCFLLFSCDKDEAFPIDVWVARALTHYYPRLLEMNTTKRLASKSTRSLSGSLYASISSRARSHFGKYAGYAQQYLFMLARTNGVS